MELQKRFEPIENMHMRVCKFSSNEFAHLQKIDPPFILHNENSIKVTTILQFKWRIFSQPGKKGSVKIEKSLFFLLGLKITLRTCFESNKFLSNSFPELSNQVLIFSEGQNNFLRTTWF